MITADLSSSKPCQQTRRAIRRSILKARVTWQIGAYQEVSNISDLSLSGLFIETTEPQEIGTLVDLFWEAPGTEMKARAIVRRSIPGRGMGVEFMEMGAEDMTRLLDLLRGASEQELSKTTSNVDNHAHENKPAGPPDGPIRPAKISDNSPIPRAIPPRAQFSERRTNLRHKVTAVVEIVESESGQGAKAPLGNLGRAGCYVKATNPSPVGTLVNVHIASATQSFQAHARVVYNIPGKGMGLLFTALDADELRILDSWLEAAVETSWLESNRRRSQRIALAVKVQVVGHSRLGEHFRERTQTVSISPHGAMVLVSKRVDKGQQLVLRNLRTEAEAECVAVYVARTPKDQYEVGLSFMLPNRAFWGVVFPPADWSTRHPDAKGT